MEGEHHPPAFPGSAITGKLSTHRDGYGFVTPNNAGDDIFIPARFLRENLHDDLVEVRITPSPRGGKREGRIVRTMERGQRIVVGRYEEGRRHGRVMPLEERITQEIIIPPKCSGNAKNGQMVVAEIVTYPNLQHGPEGRVKEVLGWPDNPDVELLSVIRKYGLADEFPEDVLAAAELIPTTIEPVDLKGRTDLRDNLTVTIDGEKAMDFDDAVSIRREPGGSFRLWVSIADVAHYAPPGSSLDNEAFRRGTSVYFTDRCLPMLPERLSNGICSLKPDVDRLALTAELLFGRGGNLKESKFYPSVIRSTARLTYSLVRELLEGGDPLLNERYADLLDSLRQMEKLAGRLMEKRRKRGSIDFDLPEPEIVIGLQGTIIDIVRSERNIAHRIIEEFMLVANEAAASFLEKREIPSLYRIHETPDPLKINDFREFIHSFGYEMKITGGRVDPGEFQRILDEAEGKPEERMINEVMLRCMKQARYSSENLGHYGLASRCYTHFTSPIRRYPDLVVHRLLKKALKGGMKRTERERAEAELPETAAHSSRMERVAMEAERDIVSLKKVQFMKDKIGEEYEGFITGVMNYGFFVELVDYFVEGMVHISQLPRDYYRYMEKEHALFAERSKRIFRIGDRIRIRITNVNIENRRMDFTPAELTGKDTFIEDRVKCDDNYIIKRENKDRIKGKPGKMKRGGKKKDTHTRRGR
jgi:ribonuclease R